VGRADLAKSGDRLFIDPNSGGMVASLRASG